MAVERYLAFDFGAGSGRAVLGELDKKNNLQLTEIHRFSNQPIEISKTLYWNTLSQYSEIKNGLSIFASKYSKVPRSIGIDTWVLILACLTGKESFSRTLFATGIKEPIIYLKNCLNLFQGKSFTG